MQLESLTKKSALVWLVMYAKDMSEASTAVGEDYRYFGCRGVSGIAHLWCFPALGYMEDKCISLFI